MALAETKGKERPLAARRTVIAKATEEDSKIVPKSAEDDPDVPGLIGSTDETDAGSSVSAEKSSSSMKLPPKKTMEEIEREVAENTKKFDERTLGKATKEKADSSKKKEVEPIGSEKSEKTEDASLTSAEKLQKAKMRLAAANKHKIDPSIAMRFLRLLLIISLATFTGKVMHLFLTF
jgi:hypothetical protein